MTGHAHTRSIGSGLVLCGALAWPAAALPPTTAPRATPPVSVPLAVRKLDPQRSRFGFGLRTLWGQRIRGRFPRYGGRLTVLADGRRQVRIRLSTRAVKVDGSERYTRLARGERFFDAARYPWIEFVSVPHAARLAREGGKLRGRLSMHGVTRMETFTLLPAQCARPGHDCPVVARGQVDRRDYGLDEWSLLVGDQVQFTMRVRLADAAGPLRAPPRRVPGSADRTR